MKHYWILAGYETLSTLPRIRLPSFSRTTSTSINIPRCQTRNLWRTERNLKRILRNCWTFLTLTWRKESIRTEPLVILRGESPRTLISSRIREVRGRWQWGEFSKKKAAQLKRKFSQVDKELADEALATLSRHLWFLASTSVLFSLVTSESWELFNIL